MNYATLRRLRINVSKNPPQLRPRWSNATLARKRFLMQLNLCRLRELLDPRNAIYTKRNIRPERKMVVPLFHFPCNHILVWPRSFRTGIYLVTISFLKRPSFVSGGPARQGPFEEHPPLLTVAKLISVKQETLQRSCRRCFIVASTIKRKRSCYLYRASRRDLRYFDA